MKRYESVAVKLGMVKVGFGVYSDPDNGGRYNILSIEGRQALAYRVLNHEHDIIGTPDEIIDEFRIGEGLT